MSLRSQETQQNAVPVLMYHQIAEPAQAGSRLAVSPDRFADQIRRLHEGGYTTVTAGDLAAALAQDGPQLPPRAVVLTFDDGFADFHSRALPLLRRHGFTATVFVTTGWIADAGQHAAGRRPGQMLTWSQIAEAANAGVEIAAHSHGHPELDQVAPGRLHRELTLSKELLEDRLCMPVPGLAYPFGYSNAAVRHEADQSGYRYACAVANTTIGPRWDAMALPRLTIRQSTRPQEFEQIAAGRVPVTFVRDWSLTKGYSVVRRAKATLGGARGRA